ncbi:MAG: decarboxylating 6-phosphogluconate dehydrogenase [Chloroflexi bacterium]|nr:decarboxylating 6-phosphogluconate dehydrogenase [Chloroflexota bacterium]MDL1882540.1 decarboxylating 6-phosphogluconate dehydrogenase [Anaerolineae bacterium CFX8]
MKLAMIGLGKMGGNMTRRLLKGGHQVVVFDPRPEAVETAARQGAAASASIAELVGKLEAPRAVWLMVPAGDITENAVTEVAAHLEPGDVVIDGGNSNYKDSIRRGALLEQQGIHFVDVGTSGGIWGLTEGYSMMVGGTETAVRHIRPALETLAPAPDRGWGHVGPTGSGHFVKMVHNGIEYGLMQAYAEGFEILRAKEDFALDVHQIAEIWRFGSVVRSWLLDLAANALAEDADLSGIKGWVADSGEGRWTVFEAIDQDVPAPVITLSLMMRFASRQPDSYAAKLLAALRNQFGGHAVKRED